MKKKILSIIFALLLMIPTMASAEFFSDVIVTSPNGIWTDSRAYTTLNAAVAAVGLDHREIVIVNEQVVVNLEVPPNVRLKFLRDGSINNSGQLTINTRDITAGDQRIFTGTGDIDFIVGSTVRSAWFSNIVEALDVTSDDYLTLIISDAEFVTSNCSVGNNVNLKWEASRNQLTINGGIELSNIGQIEAGDYQLFAGAGDFDFLDGTVLNLSWFRRLRSAIRWVETEEVSLDIMGDHTISYTGTIPDSMKLRFHNGGRLIPDPGVTVTFSEGSVLPLLGFVDLEDFIDHNGATNITLVIDTDDTMSGDVTVPSTVALRSIKGNIITITGHTLTILGPFECGLYQAFSETGTVEFGSGAGELRVHGTVKEIYPQWWGAKGDGTDATAAITAAVACGYSAGIPIYIPAGHYLVDTVITVSRNTGKQLTIFGDESGSTEIMQVTADTDLFAIGTNGSAFTRNVTMRDLQLGCVPGTGSVLKLFAINNCVFENITIPIWGNAAFHLIGGLVNKFISCKAADTNKPDQCAGVIGTPGTYAFYLQKGITGMGCNANVFIDCAANAGTNGWYITDHGGAGANTIIGGDIEGGTGVAFYAVNVYGMVIDGLWIEWAGTDGMKLEDCQGWDINLTRCNEVQLINSDRMKLRGHIITIDIDANSDHTEVRSLRFDAYEASIRDLSLTTKIYTRDLIEELPDSDGGIVTRGYSIVKNGNVEFWDTNTGLPNPFIKYGNAGWSTITEEVGAANVRFGSSSVKVVKNTASQDAGLSLLVPDVFEGQWISVECWKKDVDYVNKPSGITLYLDGVSVIRKPRHAPLIGTNSWQRWTASAYYDPAASSFYVIFGGRWTDSAVTTYFDGIQIWAQFDPYGDVITFTDTDATPSINYPGYRSQVYKTGNIGGAVNVTDFDEGYEGQIITIIGADGGNSTIKDNAALINLAGADFVVGDEDVLTLVYDGVDWDEVSRSDN